jgi:alpha-L-fucosidase
MKAVNASIILISALISVILVNCAVKEDQISAKKIHYEPTWESLSQWKVPQWFDDGVLGIYCHWGVYSVPGYRFNDGAEQVDSGLWYGWFMYVPNGSEQPNFGVYDYHRETYGEPCEYSYHEFVPMFKAEKWDPDEWAELYKYAGADFAGVAAEHGDGFIMWDSEFDEFNSMEKGPRRDILGEMFEAARKVGMKTVATFHEPPGEMFDAAREYCPEGSPVFDPTYADLYNKSPFSVLNKKLLEVVDKYQPDQVWFEDMYCGEENWKPFLAHYFNSAEEWGKEVLIAQKHGEAPLSCSILDIEGRIFPDGIWEWAGMTEPQEQRWQKDVPIGNYWAYAEGVGCRPVNMLVDGIVDRISKNGVTLLNVAPKADGTLPQAQIEGLKELGEWMAINKEALYAAKPAHFVEGGSDDWKVGTSRLLEKDNYLYVIELGNVWPTEKGFADYEDSSPPSLPIVIPNVKPVDGSVIRMLGSDQDLAWRMDGDDLVIEELPSELPCDYAWSFKIKIHD